MAMLVYQRVNDEQMRNSLEGCALAIYVQIIQRRVSEIDFYQTWVNGFV